ncbi:MAG: cytochrome c [Gemmatimonadota bacterium]
MRSRRMLPARHLLALLLLAPGVAFAQSPTYGVGRTPTPEEIRAWDIAISPTGEELPPGSGTAVQGAVVYQQKCAACHGAQGTGGIAPRLVKPDRAVGNPWDYGRILPIRSPYSSLVWDYVNRGMPLGQEETLTADEVYGLTALLLYWNDLVAEEEVMDAESLPRVAMPNEDNWAPLPDWQPGQPRLPDYPY